MRPTFLIAPALAVTMTSVAFAGDDFLTIGDKAPAIDIAHWLKGEQVENFENEKVYVLEFWATWCGPCVGSMPHLSEMQEKYREYDVTFIGVSDEPLQTVVEFLFKEYPRDNKIHNDRTNYTLTTDPDKSVKESYFTAAGRRGIPCAFIIGKDQHVEWIGHPMTMDDALDSIVKDSWDRDGFKETYEAEQQAARAEQQMQRKMRDARKNGDWDTVIAIFDEMIESTGNPAMKAQKYMVMAKEMGDAERAHTYGALVVDEFIDDSMMLNQIAWFIVDTKGLENRDLELATRAARRANKLTENKEPAILDTLARVFYEKGNLKKAIKIQRRAAENAAGTPFEAGIKATLEQYEQEK